MKSTADPLMSSIVGGPNPGTPMEH
jgi:hypothetical protein